MIVQTAPIERENAAPVDLTAIDDLIVQKDKIESRKVAAVDYIVLVVLEAAKDHNANDGPEVHQRLDLEVDLVFITLIDDLVLKEVVTATDLVVSGDLIDQNASVAALMCVATINDIGHTNTVKDHTGLVTAIKVSSAIDQVVWQLRATIVVLVHE